MLYDGFVRSVFKYVIGFLFLVFLSFAGVYFYVFGWSGGVRLAGLWLSDYSRDDRREFVSYLTPHHKQVDLNGESKPVFVVVGVVIDIDTSSGEIGMLSMDGYRRYQEDKDELSLYKYIPNCLQSFDSEPVFDYSFGGWLSRVRRGDFVEVIYLGKNAGKSVIPFLQIGYYEVVPVGNDNSNLCLR